MSICVYTHCTDSTIYRTNEVFDSLGLLSVKSFTEAHHDFPTNLGRDAIPTCVVNIGVSIERFGNVMRRSQPPGAHFTFCDMYSIVGCQIDHRWMMEHVGGERGLKHEVMSVSLLFFDQPLGR